MSAKLFEQYSQFEDGLIREFHEHPIYGQLSQSRNLSLSREQFIAYLLQIGFIAQNFVKWYETAKQGMKSPAASEVVREILRDEIPQNAPTHQDDRLYDLNLIGVSTGQVRNVRPSTTTRKTIERLYELVRYPQEDYDLRVMITLRVFGEVLVAEQYSHVVRYMRVKLGIQPSQSHFYFPHWQHDLKGAKSEGSAGHTDSFDKLLEEMLTDERELEVAKDAARKAFETRSGLHDQFLPTAQILGVTRQVAVVAAALALFVSVGWGVIKFSATMERAHFQAERERYEMFLRGLPKEHRDMYLAMDQWAAKRARETGSVDELAKVGTMATVDELYGRGP